ncbi:Phosphoglucomutase-2 [Dactylellina cionopaga]|nr:Phosphoglucomutase-2 [Dactylellina cionopaga]
MSEANAEKSIEQLVEEWLALDKDEPTRKEIQDLVAQGNNAELEKRLRNRIAFGTAGLRSSMQAGFAHLNPLTIIQASQGLAAYVVSTTSSSSAKKPAVIIGHDHRHNSSTFANLTAVAFILKGVKVYFMEDLVHTPLVPFGLGYLNRHNEEGYVVAAGVMITASHNPARDNGYKVYWGNGCQIIPPVDAGIAAAIEDNLVPVEGAWNVARLEKGGELVEMVKERVEKAYFETLKVMLGKMRGGEFEGKVRPDPDFPTVKFPNPEEKGALDLAMAAADKQGITIVLANDPDADRFAAAEKVDGKWRILTGNQLGVLFASHMLSTSSLPPHKISLLSSAVSTQMLSAMAQIDGFYHEETLTGFKWLGNVAQQITAKEEHKVIYAFEEAIGYMFSDAVYDKDGIAALGVFLTMLEKWGREGISPVEKLEQLYAKYGYFESCNGYVVSPAPKVTKEVFDGIRNIRGEGEEGNKYPGVLGGRKITYWRDLTEGFDSATVDGVPVLPVDKSSQMITVGMDGVRFTIRGSGTEPKIKYYVEAKASGKDEAARAAKEVADAIVEEWFRPEVYGLTVS